MGLISNGTTLLDAGAIDSGIAKGAMTLITTLTASNSATLDFTSGITSTYKKYVFKFVNIHPATDGAKFGFQFNADGASGFNETLTNTYFRSYHDEANTATGVGYVTSEDQGNGTSFTILDGGVGADNDQCTVGDMCLFNPASTTFATHFAVYSTHYDVNNFNANVFVAGYVNATAAIDEVQFKFSSGNIESGTIKMYGIT
tara:strand:+ start:668 stop:1270 length:603 start_codon:yes stop_codon:yes gene_type:complete